MSQIRMDQPLNQNLVQDPSLDHYSKNSLEPRPNVDEVPKELQNAKPVSHSSGWKIAGRVALAVVTIGFSELFRLAYLGIKSCCSSARPTEAPAPRVQGKAKGVPAVDPEISKQNATLTKPLFGNSAWPQEYKDSIDSLMNDLRTQYGDQIIPEGVTLKDLSDTMNKFGLNPRQDLFYAMKGSKQAISPDMLQQLIKQTFVPAINQMILTSTAEDYAQQIGGLGGLDMKRIVKNLLTDPELKQQLQSATNKTEVLRLADDMNLRQKIKSYQEAINGVLDELRVKFGAERVPKDLTAALSLEYDGQTMRSNLNSSVSGWTKPISAQNLRLALQKYLVKPLIHQSVENALTEKAKAMGVPVNRRSIMLLARSTLKQPEIFNVLNNAANHEKLKNALSAMGLEVLLLAQRDTIERLYTAHSDKVQPELKPLLRTFIEGLSFAPSDAAASEREVIDMVNRMKNWKNLDGSEEVRQPLNDAFKQDYAADLTRLEGSGESTGYTDNIYNQLPLDADRSDYSINGQVIDKIDAAQNLTNAVKNAVPDPKDQQFISKLINQRMWGCLVSATSSKTLPSGASLDNLPGGEILPSTPPGSSQLLQDAKINSVFTVNVSPDKKTAVVTGTLVDQMNYGSLQVDGDKPYFGLVKFTFTFNLNLNAHENGQGVADFKLGQEFIPNKPANA
ncbi:MAG: hypothetical protein IJU76_14770 [Desulfovibrionaceae bacterium]|nr:hypothetical protein [Desulfovibrionaceae bacterium]